MRQFRLRRAFTLLCILDCATLTAADDVAAFLNGKPAVTKTEIDQAIAPSLKKLAAEEAEIRLAVLRELVDEKLLAGEAAGRGMTVDALLQTEVVARTVPVSEQELAARVAELRARRPDVSHDQIEANVRASLQRKNEQAARAAFLARLAQKAGVRIFIDALRVGISTEGRPSRGPAAAPVTIVVFSDFQCPFCAESAAVLQAVQRLESDSVRLVYRHFPLPIHERAQAAAEAAECAARAGRFWPMHDALFAAFNALSDGDLEARAVGAGVERGQFLQCLSTGAARNAVDADRRAAIEAGADGTPAIFVNGRRFTGPRTIDALRRVIAEEKSSKGNRSQ
jgi:protein-disulfide isomerase